MLRPLIGLDGRVLLQSSMIRYPCSPGEIGALMRRSENANGPIFRFMRRLSRAHAVLEIGLVGAHIEAPKHAPTGMQIQSPRSESLWKSNFTRYALHAMPSTAYPQSAVAKKSTAENATCPCSALLRYR